MVLELHVWGPAFSLPSIDAQCLATIAYLSQTVPREAWVLVASSDPTVSPTCELPALKNGTTWVSKFRNIVDYLRQYSNGDWDLDGDLSGLEKADNIAFSSFVESRGQSLIDLSLYVTSQNYYNHTSPAYGSILQWPNQWILPPKLHAAAKTRTDHLGLSSLDLDAIEEQRKRDHSAAVAAGQVPPNFIQSPRDTVTRLLGKTAQQNQFKLEALTAEFFDALEEILGAKSYLLADEAATSLDCLALGYLSLALVPDLTHTWLRDAMVAKAPRLTAYTERLRRRCYGLGAPAPAHEGSTEKPEPGSTVLPWQAFERPRLTTVGATLWNALADATPIWRNMRASTRLREAAEESDSGLSDTESKALSQVAIGQRKDLLVSVATVVGGFAALAAYMVHLGILAFALEKEEEEGLGEEYEMPEAFQAEDLLSSLQI
ncbi:glutathione S-transferase family protein [Aspergillus melleus]|uniref:glutathione S-transferase family protein n=1 Tax=Aspergillus melleus TaxID=138277 RepID=UPI001E8D4BBB|nr:uncharacterized protein LDX57_000914 [Aspergillus melleus]KAH8423159.1 hypothetical protein LDX57_000914 [Aspergillus melleus]